MKTKLSRALAILCCAFVVFGASVRAAIVTPIYALAALSFDDGPPFNGYQFGVFDLDSPTGSPGSYQYAWTSLGSASFDSLANLVLNPQTSQMYLQYNFSEFRTIGTDGTLGGSSLGAMDTFYGMAFDPGANLYGTDGIAWFSLNPSTGTTASSSPLGAGFYSQFGGGLAYASDGNFYFSATFPDSLIQITPSGVDTEVGNFSGTGYDGNDWNALFTSGANTYLLNRDRLYQVNLSDASLSLMGNITGLPANFASGFSGAVGQASVAPAAVPEPGTWAAAALLAGGAAFTRWRKRRDDAQKEAA